MSPRRLTYEDFVLKANKIHGLKYKYDRVVYKDFDTKVEIYCYEHGYFWQSPNNHLHVKGYGCQKCAKVFRYGTDEFIQRSKIVHGDKYLYDKCIYKSAKTNVIITCIEHGDFNQTPETHLDKGGCAKCSGVYRPDTEEFIRQARVIYGDKYSYDKTIYKSSRLKVIISCNDHGIFEQYPSIFLRKYGCKLCRKLKQNKKYKTSKQSKFLKSISDLMIVISSALYGMVGSKICTSCGLEKDTKFFDFRNDQNCFRKQCNQCRRDLNSIWHSKNKQRSRTYNKIYAINNRSKIAAYMKWYNPRHTRYKLRTDPLFKLRHNISTAIRDSLHQMLVTKTCSCMSYLPYSIEELKKHLESKFEPWMSWDNWGRYKLNEWNDGDPNTWKWQIDHIIPQSELTFKSTDDENFKKCWALENLRPLSAKENLIKGAKIGDIYV